jgi:signal peptidase I
MKSEAFRQSLFTEIPKEFTIEGSSMAPLLMSGEKVFLKPYNGGPLSPGYSYVYREGSSLILHRYVATRGEFAIFIGDNSLIPQLVLLDNIIGQLCEEKNKQSLSYIDLVNRLFFKLFYVRRTLIKKILIYRRRVNEKKV